MTSNPDTLADLVERLRETAARDDYDKLSWVGAIRAVAYEAATALERAGETTIEYKLQAQDTNWITLRSDPQSMEPDDFSLTCWKEIRLVKITTTVEEEVIRTWKKSK